MASEDPSDNAKSLSTPHPFEDFELSGTQADVMSFVTERLDAGAKSVELFRRTTQGRRRLIGRVWWASA